MLTTQKLDNLLSYYILFYHEMQNNIDGILESHHSYIIEKYDRFFIDPPNKIKDIEKEASDNVHVFELAELGLDRWNVNIKDFMKDPDFMKWYFTFYFVHSIKEKNKNKSHGVFSTIIPRYNKFFTDYNSISNENEIYVLHELFKQFHTKVKSEYKQLYRTVLIKTITK